MLNKLWREFIGLVSDMWNVDHDDIVDVILSKFMALLIVAMATMGAMLVCSTLFVFINRPSLFLYAGVPVFVVYAMTRAIAARGKISRQQEQDEYFRIREEMIKKHDKLMKADNEDKE